MRIKNVEENMRVISGQARGLKLISLPGLETRPTTDRIKESLFNMLAADLYDAEFLDLFSGSGAIGIEALSRNAKCCTFIDNSREATAIIEKNLMFTKLKERANILCEDVLVAISKLKLQHKKYDIIFLDPPYDGNFVKDTLLAVANEKILKEEGYIVVEQRSTSDEPVIEGFTIFKEKIYKTTTMYFLKYDN